MRRSWTHARFRDLGGAHGTVSGTLFAPLAVTAPGSDGSVAWQTIIGLKVRGRGVIVYEDVVTFAYGQDNITLISFGINRPFPPEKEQSLAAFLVTRARAHMR
jgi:hypothetical protein